jgi:hypothetical protein
MKLPRCLVVVVSSVAAAVSLGVPAPAAPSVDTRSPVSEADDTVSAARAGAPCVIILSSYVSNETNVGIGVQEYPGTGYYDRILPPGQRTDSAFCWPGVASFYIGPGYCAEAYYWNGTWWVFKKTVRNEEYALPDTGQDIDRWAVRNLRAC